MGEDCHRGGYVFDGHKSFIICLSSVGVDTDVLVQRGQLQSRRSLHRYVATAAHFFSSIIYHFVYCNLHLYPQRWLTVAALHLDLHNPRRIVRIQVLSLIKRWSVAASGPAGHQSALLESPQRM